MAAVKPKLSVDLVCRWVQLYHHRTGCWPSQLSGQVLEEQGVTWRHIDQAFRLGQRGLPGGASLSQFITSRFGARPRQARAAKQLDLTSIQLLAQHHWQKTGKWPIAESGAIDGEAGENWRRVDSALKYGLRGLPKCGGLRRMIDDYRCACERIITPPNQLKPQRPAPNRRSRYSPCQIYEIINRVAAGKREGKTEAKTLAQLGIPQQALSVWRRKYGASWLDSLQKLYDALADVCSLRQQIKQLEVDSKLKSHALNFALPGPHSRRRCVEYLVRSRGALVGTACRIVGQNQSTQSNVPRAKRPRKLEDAVEEISKKNPNYGIARIQALLARDGWMVSNNTVATIRRRLHLTPSPWPPRPHRRRHGLGSCSVLPAQERDQVWSYDILHDRDTAGRRYKILAIIDEYTRECLALMPSRAIRSDDVANELLTLMLRRGAPTGIRSDNAKELVAGRVRSVLKSSGIQSIVVTRASPWENALVESFIAHLRSELLNEIALDTMGEYRILLETWREQYNTQRPHHALGYMTPAACAAGHANAVKIGEQLTPKPIPMRLIKSKWLHAIGYDADNSVMQVKFLSNEVFRYFGVSKQEYARLASASKPGRYFRDRFIRVGGLSESRAVDRS